MTIDQDPTPEQDANGVKAAAEAAAKAATAAAQAADAAEEAAIAAIAAREAAVEDNPTGVTEAVSQAVDAANIAAEAAKIAANAAADSLAAEAAAEGKIKVWLSRMLRRKRKKHQDDFDYRLQGLEKKLEGFFIAIRIIAFLVAVGLLASVSGAIERFQNVMEDSIATSVNDEINTYIEAMNTSGTEIAKVRDDAEDFSESALEAEAKAGNAMETFISGVETLEALVQPIYATATAREEMINQGQYYVVVVATKGTLKNAKLASEPLSDRFEIEYYLLPDGLYIASIGRYSSKDIAQDYRNFLTQYVKSPYVIEMGETCPIIKEKTDYDENINYFVCSLRINE